MGWFVVVDARAACRVRVRAARTRNTLQLSRPRWFGYHPHRPLKLVKPKCTHSSKAFRSCALPHTHTAGCSRINNDERTPFTLAPHCVNTLRMLHASAPSLWFEGGQLRGSWLEYKPTLRRERHGPPAHVHDQRAARLGHRRMIRQAYAPRAGGHEEDGLEEAIHVQLEHLASEEQPHRHRRAQPGELTVPGVLDRRASRRAR